MVFIAQWWLFYHSSWDIPIYIPGTHVHLPGLLLMITLVTCLALLKKAVTGHSSRTSVPQLTLTGALVILVAEIPFQLLKAWLTADISTNEFVSQFLKGMIGMTVLGTALSFLVALWSRKRLMISLLAIAALLTVMILFEKA